jgi:hypothetical protein
MVLEKGQEKPIAKAPTFNVAEPLYSVNIIFVFLPAVKSIFFV